MGKLLSGWTIVHPSNTDYILKNKFEQFQICNGWVNSVRFQGNLNKMELLQSQAPVDRELSGSSASARHGTFNF